MKERLNGRDFRYLGCNRPFLQDAGLKDAGDVLGKEDSELPWKEKAAAYRADDQSVMEQDAPKLDCEESQPQHGGDAHWIKISKLPMHDPAGKVIAVLGAYEDVTRSKQAEDSLRQRSEKAQAS